MARYGTWEREQELMALEREDREVFDDEPSGGHQAELARLAQQEADACAGRPEDDYREDDGPVPGLIDIDLTCAHDDHTAEDCLADLPF